LDGIAKVLKESEKDEKATEKKHDDKQKAEVAEHFK